MKIRAFLLSTVFFSASLTVASAQRFSTDELPKIPLDTIDTADPKTKIVTYSNNTWAYYFPTYKELASKEVFTDHWTTTSVFAYRDVELNTLPETIELTIVDDLSGFCPPVTQPRIISRYGPRGNRMHKGIDLSVRLADPVHAVFEGMVRYARYNGGGYGNLVIIRHPNGLESYYGHLSQLNVVSGDYVAAGEVIGYAGSTGRSRGTHLHFELRYNDYTFDPEHVIDFSSGDLKYQTFMLLRGYFNVSSRVTEELEENDDTDAYFAETESSEDILENIEKVQKQPRKTANDVLYYKIRRGDTLSAIARKYGTTVNNLCRMNNIRRDQKLMVGKQLRVR